MARPLKNKINSISEFNGDNLEQFILTKNLDQIMNWHNSNSDRFVYRTFRQMQGESHEIISKLRGMPDLSVFKRIKTSVLSLMQPKIRIYKVSYVGEKPIEEGSSTMKTVRLPIPCYKEFKFSDNFGIETAASPRDYLAYESTRPSFRNVGLKSFQMESLGANYGPFQKEINAKLEISFKSLKDIQAQPPGEPSPEKGGLRYFDLFAFPGAIIGGTDATETYNPKHYQIKILIGWTSPSLEQLNGLSLSPSEVSDIRKIENMNMMLSLLLQDYDIKIAKDGSVTVSIKYKSFIDANLADASSTSVFLDSFNVRDDGSLVPVAQSEAGENSSNMQKVRDMRILLVEAQKSIKDNTEIQAKIYDLIEKDQFFFQCYVEAFSSDLNGAGVNRSGAPGTRIKRTGKDKIIKTISNKRKSKTLMEVIKQKTIEFKSQVYPSFTRDLIIGFTGDGSNTGSGSRLLKINANPAEIEDALGLFYPEGEEDDATAPAEDGSSETSTAARVIIGDRIITIEDVSAASAGTAAEEAESLVKETQRERSAPESLRTVLDTPDDGHQYYFLFLGDIVELAARNSGLQQLDLPAGTKNKPWPYEPNKYNAVDYDSLEYSLMNKRMLFGPLEYYNAQRQIKTMGLAQFPIAFNLFRAWFLKNIVNRKETKMRLYVFVKKLIEDLVVPSLGGAVRESHRVGESTVSFHTLTLAGKQSKSPPVDDVEGRKVYRFKELLPVRTHIDVNGPEFINNYYNKLISFGNSEARLKTSFDYLLFQVSTTTHLVKRTGNPVEDEKDGILHFSIGSDMGMLKDISFRKVTYPYRAEQLHQMAESQDSDQLEQLVFPYNSDVTLIGIPIYTPGMRYYINPSLLGLGDIRNSNSVAHKLNLGGYNFAENVIMKIDKRGFETKLKGFFEGHGARGGRLIT